MELTFLYCQLKILRYYIKFQKLLQVWYILKEIKKFFMMPCNFLMTKFTELLLAIQQKIALL